MSWMYGSALESANFGNCVFKVLQSSNVFFLFHSVLEFPGKWIGKIQKRVSIIFWFFGLVHKHSLQTSLHNLLHVFFFRMNETTVVLKRRLQFYMKGFFVVTFIFGALQFCIFSSYSYVSLSSIIEENIQGMAVTLEVLLQVTFNVNYDP